MSESELSAFERKKELRREMLALRRALSDDEVEKRSHLLTEEICALPQYRKAKRIMAFLAMKGESNLDELISRALAEGKEVYIPVCLPERKMEAGRLLSMDHFEKGPLGLRNLPKGYVVGQPETMDLVLIPAVACDREGNRLGMGAGYYDRYLSRVPVERRIAALWDFQVVESIPSESFDERIAGIVTDKGFIITKRG